MSTDIRVAPSQLNEGCRILTISASVAGANEFVARLKALTDSKSNPPLTSETAPITASAGTSKAGPAISEYTISNRYYTAEVHFAAYALQDVYPGLFSLDRGPDYKPPPAVIFVWVDGEPYAKLVEELSRVMATASYDPEVWLAVRIPKAAVPTVNDDETHVENTDIDTTLMSFGFEYVDATRESIPKSEIDSDSTDIDIPRLPRVLDALSTIMWPSMQSSKTMKQPLTTSSQLSSANIAQRELERESIMEELLSVSGISGISRVDTRQLSTNMGKEREDDDGDSLFSPYDFSSSSHFGGISPTIPSSSQKPWLAQSDADVTSKTSTPGNAAKLVTSPTHETSTSSFGLHTGFEQLDTGSRQVSMGFEDDFTVFVSAPAESEKGTSGAAKIWTPLDLSHAGFDARDDGDMTPMATAYPDSFLTGDSLVDRNRGLTPASAQIPFKNTGARRERGRGNGPLYRSLGSVSDFGGDGDSEMSGYNALDDELRTDDEDYGAEWEDGAEEAPDADDSWEERTGDWDDLNEDLDEDGDEDMPTKEEILATAARIFGGVPAAGQFRKASEVNKEVEARLKAENPQGGKDSGISIADAQATAASVTDRDDVLDDEIGPAGPMDIESVLRSLQGLRTEIAGVEDEEERRRMAARVALGFVYGMDLEKLDPGAGGIR